MKKLAFLLLLLNTITAQNPLSYSVRAGDTLYAIASSHGISVPELKSFNGLSGDTLQVGQVLSVPGASSEGIAPIRGGVIQHTVITGHTLANIGQMYGLSEATLRASNAGLEAFMADAPLPEGLVLLVPPGEGQIILLAPGQNLLAVALEYGMQPADLGKANGVKTLQPGQYVFIPAGYAKPAETQASEVQVVTRKDLRQQHLDAQKLVITRAPNLLKAYTPPLASTQAFIWPVQGPLTSRYGRRNISVGGNTFHAGVDVAAPTGTPILAAKGGTVVKASWGGAYGYVVYIDHGDGSQTRYAHMSQIKVGVGSYVNQRDVLGLVGTTGASTGPHLHFEIRLEGRSINPLEYLPVR